MSIVQIQINLLFRLIQILVRNAGNGISETLDFKIFRGGMPTDPPPRNLAPSVLERLSFTISRLYRKLLKTLHRRHWVWHIVVSKRGFFVSVL